MGLEEKETNNRFRGFRDQALCVFNKLILWGGVYVFVQSKGSIIHGMF